MRRDLNTISTIKKYDFLRLKALYSIIFESGTILGKNTNNEFKSISRHQSFLILDFP